MERLLAHGPASERRRTHEQELDGAMPEWKSTGVHVRAPSSVGLGVERTEFGPPATDSAG